VFAAVPPRQLLAATGVSGQRLLSRRDRAPDLLCEISAKIVPRRRRVPEPRNRQETLENTAISTTCRDRSARGRCRGTGRVAGFGIELASMLRQLVPDNSGSKQQQLNLLEWDSPTHPFWFIKSGRVSLWFPKLRSHLVRMGNSSTRVEAEQIDHVDHSGDAQANFARGAIDA